MPRNTFRVACDHTSPDALPHGPQCEWHCSTLSDHHHVITKLAGVALQVCGATYVGLYASLYAKDYPETTDGIDCSVTNAPACWQVCAQQHNTTPHRNTTPPPHALLCFSMILLSGSPPSSAAAALMSRFIRASRSTAATRWALAAGMALLPPELFQSQHAEPPGGCAGRRIRPAPPAHDPAPTVAPADVIARAPTHPRAPPP